MDISKIDKDSIELFHSIYVTTTDIFGVEPIAASPKIQKKIRKWIDKNYISDEILTQETMRYIGKEVSDEDFINFLKACYNQVELNTERKKQLFDEASADLNDNAKSAIWAIFEHSVSCNKIRKAGTDAQIDVEFSESYTRTLTLLNASGLPEGNIDWLSFDDESFTKQDNEYILRGKAEDFAQDLITPFSIRFTDAKVDTTVCRADKSLLIETPWMLLESIATDILNKNTILSDKYLNDREKELLPLIVEISKLSYWAYIPDEFKGADFSNLKFYVIRLGYTKLLPLIENLEKEFYNDKKKDRCIKRLVFQLNKQKYEPLWRELYCILAESQEGYPSNAVVYCSSEVLSETRSNIQKLMEAHGYTGEYPDFVKQGAIRGIHLADAYNMTYFVGAEKNVRYHIHCTETYFNEHLMIQFICGTALLKKNESAGDIYSCLFNANGRRFFKTVSYERDYIDDNGERKSHDLEQRVQIAVKKAELKKLTKKERKELVGFDIPYLKLFFLLFVVMGGLFAVFMTLGFMLMGVILGLILGLAQEIPSMFTEVPWWSLFFSAWGIFGGIMSIITILSMRK